VFAFEKQPASVRRLPGSCKLTASLEVVSWVVFFAIFAVLFLGPPGGPLLLGKTLDTVRSALPGRSWIAVCKVLFSFAGSLMVPPLATKMILFMTFSRSVLVSAAGLGLLGWRLRSRLHGFLFALRQQLAALQTLKL
jgi:hypothetical protein